MNARFRYLSSVNVVLVRQNGFSTYAGQLALSAQIARDIGCQRPVNAIVDLTEFTGSDVNSRQIFWQSMRFKRLSKSLKTPVKLAVNAPTDLGYGLCNMYRGFALGGPNLDIEIFSDLQSATHWMLPGEQANTLFENGKWHRFEHIAEQSPPAVASRDRAYSAVSSS